jgi:membrane-bound ClpP family serine protease
VFVLYIIGIILMVAGLVGVLTTLGTAGWTAIIVGAVLIVIAYAVPHYRRGPP